MNADAIEKLKQLRSLLAYHKMVGIEEYCLNDDIDTFFNTRPGRYSENLDVGEQATVRQVNRTRQPLNEGQSETIAELCEEITICHSCDLAKKRIRPVCGRSAIQVKLFIVGSWLTVDASTHEQGEIFGAAEDQMLDKMLKAIHLTSDETFVANVIKCGIANTVQPQALHIDTCLSFLERQIAVTSPKIICTMGTVATRALLKVKQPLSQLRGTFHEYRLGEHIFPLMPTYHPSFLLKNPEMKRPTWSDLQQIEKALTQ